MRNKDKLRAGLVVAILLIGIGAYYAFQYSSTPAITLTNQSNITGDDQVKGNTGQSGNVKKSSNQTTDSKYVTTYCKRCGKAFKQLKNGPGYTYCEKCMNNPEVQKEWEKETEGTP